jgi:hypothetical protein
MGVTYRLIATVENVDLHNEFAGILVIDGIQKALVEYNDGHNKDSAFYGLLKRAEDSPEILSGKSSRYSVAHSAFCGRWDLEMERMCH